MTKDEDQYDSEDEGADCPICNKQYERADTKYPLLCETKKCHFNMCFDCTSNFLEARKTPEEASDGNTYTLKIQCPSCRADFIAELSDILLMRESVREIKLTKTIDSELSAYELRRKHDAERTSRLKAAERRYKGSELTNVKSEDELFFDSNGENDHEKRQKKKIDFIDTMLFCGLHESMTPSERIYVKELMTDGSVTKLMQAAHILASIVDMNRNGGTPSMRNLIEKKASIPRPKKITTKSRSQGPYKSYEDKLKKGTSRSHIATTNTVSPSLQQMTPQNRTELQLDAKYREKWKRLYPIPIRMPKAMNITLDFDVYSRWRCALTFADDELSFLSFRKQSLNGSDASKDVRSNLVRDAFEAIQIGYSGNIFKKEPQNKIGVENILTGVKNNNINDHVPSIIIPWRRVVVSSVRGELLKSGIKTGDVITHVDGEPFEGNSEKLRQMLAQKQQFNTHGQFPTCQIIVNAEVGIAEALRVRKVVAESRND